MRLSARRLCIGSGFIVVTSRACTSTCGWGKEAGERGERMEGDGELEVTERDWRGEE